MPSDTHAREALAASKYQTAIYNEICYSATTTYEPLTVLNRTPSASAATAVTPSAVPAAAPRRQSTTPDSLGAIGTNRMLTPGPFAVAFITRLDAMKSGSVDTCSCAFLQSASKL